MGRRKEREISARKFERSGKGVFQKYIEARKEIDQLAAVKSLADGYKLGLTLTAEAFVSRGEMVGE